MNMRRRDFIAGAAVVPLLPRAARPETSGRIRRVGVLLIFAKGDPEAQVRIKAFGKSMRQLDWREGDNVHIEYRFAAGDFERMRESAKELVELGSEVIVTNSIQAIIAVWQQTRTVPIVFAMCPDPVDTGLLQSLSHPGETITGFTTFELAIVGKWLELLNGVAPRVTRAGLMFNPEAYERTLSPPRGYWEDWVRQLESSAPAFGVDHIALPVRTPEEMDGTLADFAQRPGSGLLVATDPLTVGHYQRIVSLRLQHQLPACYPYRYFATAGGLMSYGPNGAAMFRQAASYVDRILMGARPGDLPIQRPNKFEFVLNLRTALSFGLDVQRSLIVRADEVIE